MTIKPNWYSISGIAFALLFWAVVAYCVGAVVADCAGIPN